MSPENKAEAGKTEDKSFGPGEPQDQSGGDSDEFISTAQSISDSIEDDIISAGDFDSDDSSDDSSDESDKSDEQDTDASESADDDSGTSDEDSDDQDSETSDGTNKDGFKKGIEKLKGQRDQLKEKNQTLAEENEALKQRLDALEEKVSGKDQSDDKSGDKSKDKKFSKKELVGIIKEFMDEGDAAGIYDVLEYMNEQTKNDLVGQYRQELRQQQESVVRQNQEWQTIVKDYSADSYKNDTLKGDPDFDITNQDGQLFINAKNIYENGIKKKDRRYMGDGGMAYAVQQAFTALLKDVVGKPKQAKKSKSKDSKDSKETEGLKQRLIKQQRKQSLGGGDADGDTSKDTSSNKPHTDKEDLSDYLSERSKFRNERMGSSV